MLQFRHKRYETYHIRLVQNAHVQQRFQYHGPFAAIAGAVTQPTQRIQCEHFQLVRCICLLQLRVGSTDLLRTQL